MEMEHACTGFFSALRASTSSYCEHPQRRQHAVVILQEDETGEHALARAHGIEPDRRAGRFRCVTKGLAGNPQRRLTFRVCGWERRERQGQKNIMPRWRGHCLLLAIPWYGSQRSNFQKMYTGRLDLKQSYMSSYILKAMYLEIPNILLLFGMKWVITK